MTKLPGGTCVHRGSFLGGPLAGSWGGLGPLPRAGGVNPECPNSVSRGESGVQREPRTTQGVQTCTPVSAMGRSQC